MAAYLRRKTKQFTSKYGNELQEPGRTQPGTVGNQAKEDRTRFLENPAILDTLDSVHRSLLFNNLKFDTDEHINLTERRGKQSTDESAASITRTELAKVNIPEAVADEKSNQNNDAPEASASYGVGSVDDELAELFGQDWNNNRKARAIERASQVKMMVRQYEQAKGDGKCPSRTSGLVEGSHHDVPSICDVETSDFESASVTSGSSVCGDGGVRSVRTSSAFSEGSRDVASVDRFDIMASDTNGDRRQQQDDPTGHNTLITININYRCDTNPLRANEPTATTACVQEAVAKTVDVVVSKPPQAIDSKPHVVGELKSLKNENQKQMAMKRQSKHLTEHRIQDASETEEERELMELEEEQNEGTECKAKANRLSNGQRSSLTNHRPCHTPEDEEYHDCNDLHESTLSFYEQATSNPVTPQDKSKRASHAHDSSSSPTDNSDVLDADQPMIRIVQELSKDEGEVTSTITLNKAQIKEMQEANDKRRSLEKASTEKEKHSPREKKSSIEKHEGRRKSRGGVASKRYERTSLQRQQRIMDDNFCNEILDSTIHFDRMYGIERSQRYSTADKGNASPTQPEECFSDSVVCDMVSPGEESFDSSLSVGKLEGKPRYSGKTVGKLMMKRLRQLHGRATNHKSSDTSDTSTSGSLLHTSGPKKPPRTFANSPKRVTTGGGFDATQKDIASSTSSVHVIGWKLDDKPKTHQVGWTVPAGNGKNESIPAQVYNMLHYSEDEGHKQLIRVGNSKPAPQQSVPMKTRDKYRPNGEPLGPKLDIDTVDSPMTPSRRHSSSTDFDRFVRGSNVKSTPHRKSEGNNRSNISATRADTRRIIEEFLNEERTHHGQVMQRKLPGADRRRRTTTADGGIFERRRQQQENFLDDARRTNHEPRRRRPTRAANAADAIDHESCPISAPPPVACSSRVNGAVGKVEKRRTFHKAALMKRTRTLFEASKRKIMAMKKFETPKKSQSVSTKSPSGPDPNINRNSSVKKKNNLHHKHLGFTPEHLRCRSCRSEKGELESEKAIVPLNYRSSHSRAPAHSSEDENKENYTVADGNGPGVSDSRQRCVGPEVGRKSARSLNFANALQGQRAHPAPEDGSMSPRKNETKLLMTLRNLKISPKRIFGFAPHSSNVSNAENDPTSRSENHFHGEFESYDDLNLDNVANMGDFLNNIRRKIDGEMSECQNTTGSAFQPNAMHRTRHLVDVHDGQEDPIYQEISPKSNKMILNEFISADTNKRYLMVNNNPNILYAMVESKSVRSPGRLLKTRSLTNVHGSSGVGDPTVTSTPVSKPQNNTSRSQVKPSNRRATVSPHSEQCGVDSTKHVSTDSSSIQQQQSTNVGLDEPESSLYVTAVQEVMHQTQIAPNSSVVGDGGEHSSSIGRGRISFNVTGSTAASSTRRSLFSEESSFHSRQQRQQERSTDDSDISVLQEEDSGEEDLSCAAIVEEPLIVRERVEDRLATHRESERLQRKPPVIPSNGRGYRVPLLESQNDLYAFEKDIIVEEQIMGNTNEHGVRSEERQHFVIVKQASKSVQVKTDGNGVAPLGCFDTDTETESLRRYQDGEIQDLVHSLHDNVTLSDIGTLETGTTSCTPSIGNELDDVGYDTVDVARPVSHVFRQPTGRNVTIDTVDVSELISHGPDDSRTSHIAPNTSSPSKLSSNGVAVMRNLKDKLRSSFRKSKSFIKNERQRIANYLLEDRTSSKSSSPSSSSASTPKKRQPTTQSSGSLKHRVRTPQRDRLPDSDQETDEMYRSFTDASDSIMTTADSSMMELSSQHMHDLMHQIVRQGDARKQLKQALAICRSTREFECSPELIEAERLLLVATQKETAVRHELNTIDYLTNGMTLLEGKRVGSVTLNNFEFPLKDAAVRDTLFNYFYVVVCTYKHEVKATVAKERHADGRVYFRDCAIDFHDLDANYEIRVEVFMLQLRKNVKNYSFESRYHLEKESKRPLSCPSPSKKLREAGRMLSFRANSPKTFDFDNEFSRFKSQGFLTLTSFALVASGSGEGEDVAVEDQTFDATYATAHTSHPSRMSTMLVDDEHHGADSAAGHLHPIVCRQDDRNVVFVAKDFKYLTLDSMAYTSNMIGTIGMSVHSEVRFACSNVSGFLDVCEKVDGNEGSSWNRRWCKMNGFMLEFWNYPQECHEKQPILYIDLVKCINERIELADRAICSRPRAVKVDIFASRAAATSCNSSGIGSFKSTGRTISPTSVGEPATCAMDDRGLLRPASSSGSDRNNVACYLLAADTQHDLKGWLVELNRAVKFLKEWKI